MKQIRNNIFETNSSSTHVLVIDSGKNSLNVISNGEGVESESLKPLNYYYSIEAESNFNPDDYCYYVNANNPFHHNPFICKTFDAKVDYLYTLLSSEDPYPNWKDELRDCIANRYKISKDNIIFRPNSDYSVDHGSEHLEVMLQDVGSIKNILENDKYYILSLGEEE